MNVKLQLFFDKGIAKPLAFLLNYLVQLVGKILRINHDSKEWEVLFRQLPC